MNEKASGQPTFFGIGGVLLLYFSTLVSFELAGLFRNLFAASFRDYYVPPISLLVVIIVGILLRPKMLNQSRWKPRVIDIAIGVLAGGLVLVLEFLAERNSHRFLGPLPERTFVPIVILAPIIEEVFFRGILLRSLREHFPPWMAIALVALLAALGHTNFWVDLPAQLVLSVAYISTGNSLAASVTAHITTNMAVFLLARAAVA